MVVFDGGLAQEGDHGVGTAEGEQARLQSLEEDRRRQRDGDRPGGDGQDREGSDREAVGAIGPAPPVRPQLVGDAAAEQDQDEGDPHPQGQGETDYGDDRQRHVGDERFAEPDQGAGDQRPDRRRQPVEEAVQVPGEIGLDVEDREAEHEDEARQHEPEAGEEAAELAAAQAAEVDAELVGLGAGKDLVDRQQLLEARLVDPAFLIDALVLNHRDLRGRSTPGEQAELEETDEDRAG